MASNIKLLDSKRNMNLQHISRKAIKLLKKKKSKNDTFTDISNDDSNDSKDSKDSKYTINKLVNNNKYNLIEDFIPQYDNNQSRFRQK